MTELWAPIRDYSYYKISSLGRVCSTRNNKSIILTPKPLSSGYVTVHIIKDDKTSHHERVHRLVAETFIPNPEKKEIVDHINRNRSDNRVENLRWVTAAENGQNISQAEQFKVKSIGQYDEKGTLIKIWDSIISIERELGISKDIITTAYRTQQSFQGYYWIDQSSLPIAGEEWKSVIIGEHTLIVSTEGRVRTLAGNITYGHKVNTGYRAVHIGDITMVVHRIICLAFKPIENPDDYQVNHIDGDKHNNRISNLEWVTGSQNVQHAHTLKPTKSQRPVVQLTLDGQIIKHHITLKQAAQELGVHICCIINVCEGKYQTSKGYKWRYSE